MLKSIKTGVLTVIFISTAFIVQAQKKITEGTIIYGIEYKLTEEQKSAMGDQEPPAELKLKFNNGLTKVAIEQGPIIFGIISDNNDNTGLFLIDVIDSKKQFAIKQSKEDIENAMKAIPKYSDFKATGEKQIIAGFSAEKYTYKDDNDTVLELWATKDIQLPNVGSQNYFPGLNAFAVKYTLIQRGIETTTILKSLDANKVGLISKEIPTGYEVIAMEDLTRKLGE